MAALEELPGAQVSQLLKIHGIGVRHVPGIDGR